MNGEETVEAPAAKSKKGKSRAALERARAEAEGDHAKSRPIYLVPVLTIIPRTCRLYYDSMIV